MAHITKAAKARVDTVGYIQVRPFMKSISSENARSIEYLNCTDDCNAVTGVRDPAVANYLRIEERRKQITDEKGTTYSHAFEFFRNCIIRYAKTPLSSEQFEQIIATMRPKTFRKKQYFLQEGDTCKYFGFIVKGAMRQYSVDDKGIEHIVRLSLENYWVGDRESWVMLSPSIYNIDAWEDTEMLLVTKEDTVKLAREIPAYDEMIRGMDEKLSIATQKRVHAAISLSADRRYADFANNYPEFLQRFPLHIIASYLGITKETLSRVRKQSVKRMRTPAP